MVRNPWFALAPEAFMVLGVVYKALFGRDAKVRRAVGGAERVRIASARPGAPVKIVGKVVPVGEPLGAPYSGRHCVHYDLVVEETRGGGGATHLARLHEDRASRDFLVQDGSGSALVRAMGADFLATVDRKRSSTVVTGPDPRLVELLAEVGKEGSTFLGIPSPLRVLEGVFEAGEHVAVHGIAKAPTEVPPEIDPALLARQPLRLIFESTVDCTLRVSDEREAILRAHSRRSGS